MFYNDVMCVRCANWYIPTELIDADGLCPRCRRLSLARSKRRDNIASQLSDIERRIDMGEFEQEAMSGAVVYFVRGRNTERVKIGVASDINLRLAQLQTGSPDPLDLLGVLDGGYGLEKALHEAMDAYHSHGEWFNHCTLLLKFIKKRTYRPKREWKRRT